MNKETKSDNALFLNNIYIVGKVFNFTIDGYQFTFALEDIKRVYISYEEVDNEVNYFERIVHFINKNDRSIFCQKIAYKEQEEIFVNYIKSNYKLEIWYVIPQGEYGQLIGFSETHILCGHSNISFEEIQEIILTKIDDREYLNTESLFNGHKNLNISFPKKHKSLLEIAKKRKFVNKIIFDNWRDSPRIFIKKYDGVSGSLFFLGGQYFIYGKSIYNDFIIHDIEISKNSVKRRSMRIEDKVANQISMLLSSRFDYETKFIKKEYISTENWGLFDLDYCFIKIENICQPEKSYSHIRIGKHEGNYSMDIKLGYGEKYNDVFDFIEAVNKIVD